MTTLGVLAEVVRSKNASPFRTTLDVFFSDRKCYEQVKDSGALSTESISRIYNIDPELVEGIYFVDQAHGIKITIVKSYPSFDFNATDCYGAQQHLPLLTLEIPEQPIQPANQSP